MAAMPRILVTEDDAPVRALISLILTREGFDVLCPPNHRLALELAAARAGEIDLVVADVDAFESGIDDSQILEQLKRRKAEPALLFLSSAGEPAAHAGNWLGKPFRPVALVRRVKRLLPRRRPEPGGGRA